MVPNDKFLYFKGLSGSEKHLWTYIGIQRSVKTMHGAVEIRGRITERQETGEKKRTVCNKKIIVNGLSYEVSFQ
jgi:hypothetical protein